MRRVQIFSGSSHPVLAETVCQALGTVPSKCELKKFSNGETSVNIGCSIRNQDVFVVQSGSNKVNDSIMELLILISACKGGSANKITAVMPYFPYSRQSKKKSQRGAITARMIANLLSVAGVSHVITVDLHASQMQGFFGKPVDNLHAEPLIARWIRHNVPNWREAVVVSKNPGGTKRVTSLADALKLNFGIVTTDRRRGAMNMSSSMILAGPETCENSDDDPSVEVHRVPMKRSDSIEKINYQDSKRALEEAQKTAPAPSHQLNNGHHGSSIHSPLAHSTRVDSISNSPPIPPRLARVSTSPLPLPSPRTAADGDDYTDERAREVITGRLIHGHIVDDDYPSPSMSATSNGTQNLPTRVPGLDDAVPSPTADPMTASHASSFFSVPAGEHSIKGDMFDGAGESSDEEEQVLKNPEVEHMVTLVGNVRGRAVFILDDMIEKSGTWIAAAETVRKRGGAEKVYCIATHGVFGNDSLQEMQNCECIDYIVVTNTYPIPPDQARRAKKLIVLDISNLLSEAIRRNHYGESISALFQHYLD